MEILSVEMSLRFCQDMYSPMNVMQTQINRAVYSANSGRMSPELYWEVQYIGRIAFERKQLWNGYVPLSPGSRRSDGLVTEKSNKEKF